METDSGTTILHTDGSTDKELLPLLMKTGRMDINKALKWTGKRPLHFRLSGTDPESLIMFLSYKPNVNATDIKGDSALHMARSTEEALLNALLAAGADVDLQNNEGDTPLHVLANRREKISWLLNAGIGLDPTFVDYEGNTVLVELALKCPTINIGAYEYLLRLGLDIDQANNAGRTVLHILCGYEHDRESWNPKWQLLKYVIQVCANLNPRDHDGIQPLHIAASISEVSVFKLLNAGADLFGATKEGMTILHIAARARQSGTIGIVLSRIADLEETKRKAFINQQNHEGNAALHYACRSGRPETVKALLEAGADPNLLDKDGNSPFGACAHFEAEQKGDLEMEHDTTRLGEIFEILILHGAVVNGDDGSLQSTFNAAVSYQHEYTVDCLLRLSDRIPDLEPVKHSMTEDYLLCSYRLEATKRALRESGRYLRDDKISEKSLAEMDFDYAEELVSLRHYDLLEERVSEGLDLARLNKKKDSFLHLLVSFGYKGLLVRYCSRDAALKFDDHDWCQLTGKDKENAAGRRQTFVQSLLFAACKRQLPNMDVLKFLVEDIGVNINVQHRKYKGLGGSVLHSLAAGFHWWHVVQALPYLIKMGRTPLHIALDFYKNGPFYKETARILVENGADVNAADLDGKSCLSTAGRDVEMTKLLLSQGAKVNAVAILEAVQYRQIEVFKELLSRGDNANLKIPGPETTEARERREKLNSDMIIETQIFPLLKASLYRPATYAGVDKNVDPRQVMLVLLNHGADPYATFFKHFRVEVAGEKSHKTIQNSDSQMSGSTWKQETRIVIHEIFAEGEIVEPFFHLPTLQLELRDPTGRTLLLAAFEGKTLGHTIDYGEGVTKTVLQELLDRGADVSAQDNDGKTILHCIEGLGPRTDIFKILKALLNKAPSLIHLAGPVIQPCTMRSVVHVYYINPPFFYGQHPDVRFADYPELLLDHGADPLQPDHKGNTALHHLAKGHHLRGIKDLFQRFLDAGVDINDRNEDGISPLFYYVQECALTADWIPRGDENSSHGEWHDPFFDVFKDAGADLFVSNDEGTTLLHLLAARQPNTSGPRNPQKDRDAIVGRFKYLMELGLDPMAEDAQQRTSLDIAAAYGSEHIIKLFKRETME
ncbi:ankyrin 2-3/unc44 [Penicillium sp. IBT 16267x]|nr:ankyrin 2-3/unc44 [Penicillium sp. IBT 16267x]